MSWCCAGRVDSAVSSVGATSSRVSLLALREQARVTGTPRRSAPETHALDVVTCNGDVLPVPSLGLGGPLHHRNLEQRIIKTVTAKG